MTRINQLMTLGRDNSSRLHRKLNAVAIMHCGHSWSLRISPCDITRGRSRYRCV